jgi:hypothetical protein
MRRTGICAELRRGAGRQDAAVRAAPAHCAEAGGHAQAVHAGLGQARGIRFAVVDVAARAHALELRLPAAGAFHTPRAASLRASMPATAPARRRDVALAVLRPST